MQTPAGYEIVDGRVVPVDWLAVIFNPSFPYRLVHMGLAAFLSTSLVVGACAAWHMMRGNRSKHVHKMFAMAMGMLVLVAPLQAYVGDAHGLNTLQYQPAKIAAIEGHWENEPGVAGVPLTLIGWPDMEQERTRFAIQVPHLGSLILTHSWDGQFKGLKSFPAQDRPNSTVVFWTFRIMVGLGLLMITLGLWALWARWRGRLYDARLLHRFALCMGPAGLVAILAGWYTTEIGRQPWVVYGLMRTADAVTPHQAPEVGLTLLLFVVVYFLVFGAGIGYLLRLMRQAPDSDSGHTPASGGPGENRSPARPISAATHADSAGHPAAHAAAPAGTHCAADSAAQRPSVLGGH
jgi:cytochrome d ubiquinol oxidase subunit I